MIAPIHLTRLLEIHCSPAMESCPHLARSTGQCRPVEDLFEWGLIEMDDETTEDLDYTPHGYRTTEKGRAFIAALERTPMPVQVWQVPPRND